MHKIHTLLEPIRNSDTEVKLVKVGKGDLETVLKTKYDVMRRLRMNVNGEQKPFAQVATSTLEQLQDPSSDWVEHGVSVWLPSRGGNDKDLWFGMGRLLAKCVIDGVHVFLEKASPVVYQVLARGPLVLDEGYGPADAEGLCALVGQLEPATAAEWGKMLASRHGSGGLCRINRFAGFEGEKHVTDLNKRIVIAAWAKHLLLGSRLTHFEALHHGFIHSLTRRSESGGSFFPSSITRRPQLPVEKCNPRTCCGRVRGEI